MNKRPLVVAGGGGFSELVDENSLLIPSFASAPTAGANSGAILRVGTSLLYDNGTMLVPLDQQGGDWAGRTVTDEDATIGETFGVDENIVYMASADAHSVFWTSHADVPFDLNKPIDIIQVGAGAVTVVAPTGVTFVGPGVSGASVMTSGQGKALSFIQRALNVWQVIGGWSGTSSGSLEKCALFRSTGDNYTGGQMYAIPFDESHEEVNDVEMHDTAISLSKITIKTAAVYDVSGFIQLDGQTHDCYVWIRKNGTIQRAITGIFSTFAFAAGSLYGVEPAQVGDYYELLILPNSSGSFNGAGFSMCRRP